MIPLQRATLVKSELKGTGFTRSMAVEEINEVRYEFSESDVEIQLYSCRGNIFCAIHSTQCTGYYRRLYWCTNHIDWSRCDHW